MSLEINQLGFSYRDTRILDNVSFKVSEGELVGLVGPNGAGKSTLIKCINRILTPGAGTSRFNGHDISNMTIKEIAGLFGYVPQSTRYAFPATVFDTVLLGRRPFLSWTVGEKNRHQVYDILIRMGLDHLALRQFNELSGGEQQKTLVARALAQEPRVLLLDEPTASLDLRHQLEVMDHVISIVKQHRICAVMAIHDLNLASMYADRMVILKDGALFRDGPPGDVLSTDTILAVYGVTAKVNHDSERPHIVLLRKGKTSGPENARALAPEQAGLSPKQDISGQVN